MQIFPLTLLKRAITSQLFEIVTLFKVRDESGAYGPPSEAFLRQNAGGGIVDWDEGSEETKLFGCFSRRFADGRQPEARPD